MGRDITRWPGDDGYDRMDYAQRVGWRPVSSWGVSGWDMGSWPYVCVYYRNVRDAGQPDRYQVAVDVEGDVDVHTFDTLAEAHGHLDGVALFYWRGESWAEGIADVSQMPERLRGPFSWERLDRAKAAEAA